MPAKVVCRTILVINIIAMTVTAQQMNRASHVAPSDARQAIGTQCYDVTRLDFSKLAISTGGWTFVFHNGIAV